jgi:hypothetical protein
VPRLPARASPRARRRGGSRRPFRWVDVAELARGHARYVVRHVVADELKNGRIESDGNGRVRLRAGALTPAVVAALGGLDR